MSTILGSRCCVMALAAAVTLSVLSARASGQQAIQARGSWRLNDGSQEGKWEGRGRLSLSPGGGFAGSMVLSGFPGFSQVNLDGQVWNQRIQFGRVARSEEPAVKGVNSEGSFDATFSGVRIEGTFTTPEGAQGQWQGWWTAAPGKEESKEVNQ